MRYVYYLVGEMMIQRFATFPTAPEKADISGANWGYTLAESDSSLAKSNPFWLLSDITVFTAPALPLKLKLTTMNSIS